MSNKILDNGTILTLGLVGAVAAIGAAAKRGVYGSRSTATASVMEDILDHLNDAGFNFEMMDDHLLMDDSAKVSISADSPLDEAQEPTMVEVARRIEDRNGNLVSLKVLGQFSTRDLAGITRALHRRDHRGSRITRGSSNKHQQLAMVRDRLNEAGFNFKEDEEYTAESMRGDPEFENDRRFVDDHHKIAIRLVSGGPGTNYIEVSKKFEYKGQHPLHRVIGTLLPSDTKGVLSAVKRNASKRKVGSRATPASKAPSLGEYDDFVVAKKSRGNKHAYYIEGHDGDLDDGWYYNSITWGVDLAGPYDNAAEALRKA